MAQIQLTPAQRKDHRAEAHHLNPVVMIGTDGLTEGVKKEIDAALTPEDLAAIRATLQQQRALGTSAFQAMVQAETQRFAGVRPAHRPRKSAANGDK